MRVWVLLAALIASPAVAGDELAEMNAVSRVWDRYANLSSHADTVSVDLLAASSLAHFGFLRDAALYASPEQLRRIPAADRLLVYLLRSSQSAAALQALEPDAVARLLVQRGWVGVNRQETGQPLPTLAQVTVLDELAVGEFATPTETQFQFGPDFVKQEDGWKFRYESLVPDASEGIEQAIRGSGIGSTRLLEISLTRMLDAEDNPPALAILDRPLRDDATLRLRLNETWPDYGLVYRHRYAAARRKAEAGDSFSQYVVGLLMINGDQPDYIEQDEAAGIALLEQASDNGNADAAETLATNLFAEPSQLDDARLRQMLPHVRRAAEAGRAEAMVMLGLFYLEGAGGLTADCRQAAAWQARGEEAGITHARNEQVWTWATCPVPGQRDPGKALALVQHMIAQRDQLTGGELDTVAATFAANGDFAQAIDYQQQAIAKLSAERMEKKARAVTLKRMRARLAGYRRGRDYVQDYDTFAEIRAGTY
ncbi:hypothetical protein [Pseudoxanthomonas wuyuanensis]